MLRFLVGTLLFSNLCFAQKVEEDSVKNYLPKEMYITYRLRLKEYVKQMALHFALTKQLKDLTEHIKDKKERDLQHARNGAILSELRGIVAETISATGQVLVPALLKMGLDEEPRFFTLQSNPTGFDINYFVDKKASEANEEPVATLTVTLESTGKQSLSIKTRITIKGEEQVSREQI